jgi:two-component system phosphate regulon sensor histidine kinase PhoR
VRDDRRPRLRNAAGLWTALIGLAALLFDSPALCSVVSLPGLDQPRLEDVPDGWGIWTDVFARLYRTRRSTEQNQQRLLENEERFRRTISALPEGIVLIRRHAAD